MSCRLPPEVLDLIVDNLHNELRVLRTCCTVSESWVPRTRRHLFVCVEFRLLRSPIESWMKGFPDPSKSPPLTLPGLSLLSRFDSTPLRVWMWAVGSAPSVASCTYACTSSVGVVIRPPSSHSTDYHPPSNHSASTLSLARLPKFSVSYVPSPFPRISRYPLLTTRTWLTNGPLLLLRRGLPGLSNCMGCSRGLVPQCGDCWPSRTVPILRRSCWRILTR